MSATTSRVNATRDYCAAGPTMASASAANVRVLRDGLGPIVPARSLQTLVFHQAAARCAPATERVNVVLASARVLKKAAGTGESTVTSAQ